MNEEIKVKSNRKTREPRPPRKKSKAVTIWIYANDFPDGFGGKKSAISFMATTGTKYKQPKTILRDSLKSDLSKSALYLRSIISLARKLGDDGYGDISIMSKSLYVGDGIQFWVDSWARNNWLKADGSVPENLDLWKEFYEIKKGLNFRVYTYSTRRSEEIEDLKRDVYALRPPVRK